MNFSQKYNDKYSTTLTPIVGTPPKSRYKRNGIIPYFIFDGEITFIMSVNRRHLYTVGDFGGRSEPGESWQMSVLREFNEESYGLLGHITLEDIKNGIQLYSDHCTITFVEIDMIDEDVTRDLFKSTFVDRKTAGLDDHLWEINNIEFFSLDEMKTMLNDKVRGYSFMKLIKTFLSTTLHEIF